MTALIAEKRSWLSNAVRVIVPISDEAPEDGGSSSCNADDLASIQNAIAVANSNNVVVSPIIADTFTQCIIDEGQKLADGTGGTMKRSTDPSGDLAQAVIDVIIDACRSESQG